ncbi:class I SAM-dependent methyltransferase [Williamsia sp. MIQD14]|uniref:class I SAM-dependent methyltransferase n=1 Tax=Williamsia sp. MIQD14 TaxID=3425703 RepID=UPI003DA09297
MNTEPAHLPPSAAAYTRLALPLYDAWVLRISTPLAWGCSLNALRGLYAENRSSDHVEVGVGTGFFLNTRAPTAAKRALTLVDMSPSALEYTAARLRTQEPVRHEGDVLNRDTLPRRQFDSVGANFLLHCLPGPMSSKAAAVENLAALTAHDGTTFGATVLNSGHWPLGKLLMRLYNQTGVFGNSNDTEMELRQLLEASFQDVEVERRGSVAIFRASRPVRS